MVSPDYIFFYRKRAVWSAHYNLQGLDSERKLGELGAVLNIEPVRILLKLSKMAILQSLILKDLVFSF